MSSKAPRPTPVNHNRPNPPRVPNSAFAGCLAGRKQAKQEPITVEELNRRHAIINAPGYINRVYGAYNSKG